MKKLCDLIPDKVKYCIQTGYSKIPAPYSYGMQFIKYSKWLEKTQWLSREDLENIQEQQFLNMVKHAYLHVPFYQKKIDTIGISLKDIQSLEDSHLIPILTKNDLRAHYTELVAKNMNRYSPTLQHTSGSTGEPLQYYIDKKLSRMISAIVWRHWNWCGIAYNAKIAVFRGSLINEFGNPSSCHFKIDNSGKQLHFSTFHMNEHAMGLYIQKLNNFKPDLIRGYPASLVILANYIRETGKSVIKPMAIHTSSEMLLPEQRQTIEDAFDAPLFDWYSHGESTVAAGECECHKGLHLNSEFGYTEFIPDNGVDTGKNIYKIISTSLWNYSLPFLRYDTEDLIEWNGRQCPCGRGLPLIDRIIGRKADIIIGKNGVKISPSSMVHFWKYRIAGRLTGIVFSQIIQFSPDNISIRLVGPKYSNNETLIQHELDNLLGQMKISFDYIDEIPSGQKWRFTVSKIMHDINE